MRFKIAYNIDKGQLTDFKNNNNHIKIIDTKGLLPPLICDDTEYNIRKYIQRLNTEDQTQEELKEKQPLIDNLITEIINITIQKDYNNIHDTNNIHKRLEYKGYLYETDLIHKKIDKIIEEIIME